MRQLNGTVNVISSGALGDGVDRWHFRSDYAAGLLGGRAFPPPVVEVLAPLPRASSQNPVSVLRALVVLLAGALVRQSHLQVRALRRATGPTAAVLAPGVLRIVAHLDGRVEVQPRRALFNRFATPIAQIKLVAVSLVRYADALPQVLGARARRSLPLVVADLGVRPIADLTRGIEVQPVAVLVPIRTNHQSPLPPQTLVEFRAIVLVLQVDRGVHGDI